MKVKSPEQSAQRWTQHTLRSENEWMEESIRAYLDSRYPPLKLKWIAGIVHAFGDIPAAARMLSQLSGYGSEERYRELKLWFDSGASITVLR